MSNRISVEIDRDLEDLIPGFLANRRSDIDKMRAALGSGDFEPIRIAGHSMKGAGGGYGFDDITRIGADIETAAQAEDVESINRGIDALEDYLERIDIIYTDD